MKCSATTVNRSSRFSPSTILLVSGDWLTGLVQNTNRLLIGGSSFISPVSAWPSRRLLTTRVPGLIQSGRAAFTQSTGKSHSGSLQHAAADVTPGARDRRDRVDRAGRLRAAGRALDRHPDANGGRLRGGELACELGDVGRLHAGDLLGIVERELGRARLQLRPSVRVVIDIVLIDDALLDHRIDDAKASAPSVPGLGQMCQSPAFAVRDL